MPAIPLRLVGSCSPVDSDERASETAHHSVKHITRFWFWVNQWRRTACSAQPCLPSPPGPFTGSQTSAVPLSEALVMHRPTEVWHKAWHGVSSYCNMVWITVNIVNYVSVSISIIISSSISLIISGRSTSNRWICSMYRHLLACRCLHACMYLCMYTYMYVCMYGLYVVDGWFMRPGLKQVELIGPLGWPRLHTRCPIGNQCTTG